MSAEQFRASAESGELPVDCHEKVLQIAYIYMDTGLWDVGVFVVVEQLHERGWSFGQGDLKFNRTLDVFYLAQIAAGIWRSSGQLDGEWPSVDDFGAFYAEQHQLLNQDAWRQYYSPAFLAHPLSARFYRHPNLQDLPDSSDPLGQPRQKGTGHFTKLPRWARNVARTRRRQPTLSLATINQIALSTLQKTILGLRKDYPSVQRFSETQARFWLGIMTPTYPAQANRYSWNPNQFGISVARGDLDVWIWEGYYSRELWDNSFDLPALEPDLDGTRESELRGCGMPDGGVGVNSWHRGWDEELGSEEDITFLAEVAVKETEGIDMHDLVYALRSHMLLAVMRLAFDTERGEHMEYLQRRFVDSGRLDEDRVEEWIRQVLMVMEPYAQKANGWPVAEEDRSELLRQILVENGHLFARWRLWMRPTCFKEFDFNLKPNGYEQHVYDRHM